MAAFTRRVGLLVGPALFVVALAFGPRWMPVDAAATLAGTLWIATWWVTEAIPLPATSLLPIALFPLLGVASVETVTAPYANPIVFLFVGGFLLALAVERWNLHRRIALAVLARTGDDPRHLVFAFMLVTAFLSMWISNTATAMMMVPIGMAVVAQARTLREGDAPESFALSAATVPAPRRTRPVETNFGAALMLGIAYSASIGGFGTIIGTPPNAILAGVVRQSLGVEIGFLQWMLFGVPFAAVMLVLTWLALMRVVTPEADALPGGASAMRAQYRALGPMTTPQRRVLAVFALVVAGWLTRPFLLDSLLAGVSDTGIAVVGGLACFLLPAGVTTVSDADGDERAGRPRLLEWDDASGLPWGILFLFGAGFSLATVFRTSGLDTWLGSRVAAAGDVHPVVFLLGLAVVVVVLSELASNTATASLFFPVMIGVAASLGTAPLSLLVFTALAASIGFMLPVATPPNTIVFGSGAVTTRQMVRAGLVVDLVGIALVLVFSLGWLPVVW